MTYFYRQKHGTFFRADYFRVKCQVYIYCGIDYNIDMSEIAIDYSTKQCYNQLRSNSSVCTDESKSKLN